MLKICLIGSFAHALKDEGHTNIGFYLAAHLKQKHHVLQFDGYDVFHTSFWKDLRNFAPDIIHFIPGATIRSFAVLRLLQLYTGAKTVLSLVNPRLPPLAWKLVTLIKPDLILNQSYESESLCNNLGIKTRFLPNGVDITKFVPVSNEDKLALREKYRIDKSKFVILHVGHLTKDRGLLPMCQLNDSENQALIIGSSYFRTNRDVVDILSKSGCLVWQTYFENIWEIYQLADCYVFLTPQNRAILQPLSILEAMSCNLPVVSLRLDGMSRIYPSGEVEGLFYLDRISEFSSAIEKTKNCASVKTRQAVLPYSWENIAAMVEDIYSQVLG